MTTVAILPVKRLGDAKTRLDGDLSPGARRALTEAMITDVLIALRRTPEVDVVLVVTGDTSASALAAGILGERAQAIGLMRISSGVYCPEYGRYVR